MMDKAADLKEARAEAQEVIAKANAALAGGKGTPDVIAKLKERLAKLEEKAKGDDATSIKIEARFVLDEMAKLG
ncbi:MAG: hypothetical protein Q4D58_01935 [Synergistaceae bacterium]|nr:hypothetical protein [Synergistaceae bacterium]